LSGPMTPVFPTGSSLAAMAGRALPAMVAVMAIATPLSVSGRWILGADGTRVKLAGVNWPGRSRTRWSRAGSTTAGAMISPRR
jgi:hypothetical protein